MFLFEQDGAYVVRLHIRGTGGLAPQLAEFTQDDIEHLVARVRAPGAAGARAGGRRPRCRPQHRRPRPAPPDPAGDAARAPAGAATG